jgi:hypothetical protein
MKGVMDAAHMAVYAIITLIVAGIIFFMADYVSKVSGQMSVDATIVMQACKEWQEKYGCERSKAALVEISVKNGEDTNLELICKQRYGGEFIVGEPAYEGCRKTLCLGCPVEKEV